MLDKTHNSRSEERSPRKPYVPPVVTRVPLVPEELFIADCVKTPSVCHPIGGHMKVKS